VLLIQ